jgi:hypothetical protein
MYKAGLLMTAVKEISKHKLDFVEVDGMTGLST